MEDGRPNCFGVGDHHDFAVRLLPVNTFEMRYDPALEFFHTFPAGGTRPGSRKVPAVPVGIIGELVEAAPGPSPVIDLIQTIADLDLATQNDTDRFGRLTSAKLRTGLNQRYALSGELKRQLPRLGKPGIAKGNALHTTDQDFIGGRMVRVSHQVNCGHGAWRSLVRSLYKSFGPLPCLVVGILLRRRLHEVTGRSYERSANGSIARQLGASNRIDDDAGGVRRIPNL